MLFSAFCESCPQECDLATFRNEVCQELDSPEHMHSRRGPMGLETGSGQIYFSVCQSCDLSTQGSVSINLPGQNLKWNNEFKLYETEHEN